LINSNGDIQGWAVGMGPKASFPIWVDEDDVVNKYEKQDTVLL
jgi:hypothetical protein